MLLGGFQVYNKVSFQKVHNDTGMLVKNTPNTGIFAITKSSGTVNTIESRRHREQIHIEGLWNPEGVVVGIQFPK